ncbi:hypothetical protein CAPTEDRAFT_219443 [Capitella teleta]|uniref:Uncharacterized protein n=1 Tax=Capitella teleta TaxID=283909 RepID=R7VFY7_CAPTE|nr:hypothetical protein CAPTEDRAFT_219443 [Capitella teleta]|eukprot:ELU15191.1 hypothetical protein CAPTEDRAFT_219443 [Capitella teleta]
MQNHENEYHQYGPWMWRLETQERTVSNVAVHGESGWSSFWESEVKAKVAFVVRVLKEDGLVARVGRACLMEIGLRSKWWKKIGKMTEELEKFIHTGFYEESVHILNNYPVGVEILGKPIHCKGVDMGDRPNNHSDGHNAKVTIPLSGAKEKGTLQCWCSRDEAENKWFADKCDLEIRGKKWTFYINPKSEKFSASEHEDKWDEHEEI